MMVRFAAPGRINLIGEHTDYNLGWALPIALPQRTVVTFEPSDTDAITVSSDRVDGSVRIPLRTKPGEVTGWAGYVAGVVWALRGSGHAVPGGTMSISSDVEMGSGLSSSAHAGPPAKASANTIAMTIHDAGMTRIAQWWQRNRRSGYATAEALALRGRSEPRTLREVFSNIFWASPLGWPFWPLLWWKMRRHRGSLYATFVTLGKMPHLQGQFDYWMRRRQIIEYK